jgi:uncharacterized protein (TIGR02265 family)
MSENTDKKLVRGLLFHIALEFLKNQKGEAAISEIEKLTGNIIYDRSMLYPLSDLERLTGYVVDMVNMNSLNEAYYQLGVFSLNEFTHSLIGATLTTLYHSPKDILENLQKIWLSMVNFGERRLVSIDELQGSAVLEIIDDPRNIDYLRGVIDSGLKAIGTKEVSSIGQVTSNNTYEIQLSWQV